MEPFTPGEPVHFDRTEPVRLRGLDRLQALTSSLLPALALAALTACSNDAPPPAATSRVEAVKAVKAAPSADKWCDVSYTEDKAPQLELPPVVPARTSNTATTLPTDKWVWVNLWATWCGPCRQEMPLILRWRDTMKKEGQDVDLWFLSLDEESSDLTAFLEKNPDMAPVSSVKISAMSDLEPWLKKYGLDAAAAIPINVLASPGGKVRCIRVGSLHEGDYGTLKSLLK